MKNETVSQNSQPERVLSRREKIARRLLPAVALSLTAGGYGAHALKEKAEYHEFAYVTSQLGAGETPIDTVRESVSKIEYSENGEMFKPSESEIVAEGQEVSRELTEQSGHTYVQAGDAIEVTVSKNGLGNYKIEADPVNNNE